MKKILGAILTAFFLTIGLCGAVWAEVRLPSGIFTDHAVFQRDVPIRVWGWANPGEKVKASFGEASVETEAASDGTFELYLPPQKATYCGKDFIVSGENEIVLRDIVVGEVWVCGGQSNMELPLGSRPCGTEEELTGDYGYIRFNRSVHLVAPEPLENIESSGWKVCAGGAQKECSAAGFHFAVRLHRELDVPVGLIDSNWSNTNIIWWIPNLVWDQFPQLASDAADAKKSLECFQKTEGYARSVQGMTLEEYLKVAPRIVGSMFNAMIAPWTPYSIRGVIWFQGCYNHTDRELYVYKQRAVVSAWRKAWKNDRLPFYWVQLTNLSEPSDDPNEVGIGTMANWPGIRDGQMMASDLPMTGAAIGIDIGEADEVHAANKFDVGNRLALLVLDDVFGKVAEGHSPVLTRMEIKDGKAYLTFDHVGGGLVIGKKSGREPMTPDPDGKLARFAIAGADRHFVWADAEITGPDTVIVSSPEIAEPAAVRYAWQANPAGCNLYSAEGLPAAPFRTDSWEVPRCSDD